MDYKVDWDALPVMDGEIKPRPLKAVSLWKMEQTGLKRLTTADSFKEMDNYIRDYSSTGHNRMKVCVLTAHWKVEDEFKGYGVMAVPIRIDRKLSMETDICEKALIQDALRQCSFIREEGNRKEAKHTNALATSLYCLDGLRDPFLSAMNKKWERSQEEFVSKYVKGETLGGQGKRLSPVRREKEARTEKKAVKVSNRSAKKNERTGKKPVR